VAAASGWYRVDGLPKESANLAEYPRLVQPKKHLGQHFLTDKRIAAQIADLVPPGTGSLVEIGPGTGILTAHLLQRFEHLTALEVDAESVAHLTLSFPPNRLTVLQQDVLTWQPPKEAQAWVGNLPYNIGSQILFKLLDHKDLIHSGVFMVQKEVAQRICAGPGSKVYGILSVLLGAYYERKLEFNVPPSVFFPPPKVQSAVFTLKPLAQPANVPLADLTRVVKTAFNQRRKTLQNALKPLSLQNIPPTLADKRPEQLSIAEFVALAQCK